MEELRLLVEMVAGLPHMALWVVAAFFIYKVAVIGSIYGVIRFTVRRLFDWLSLRHTPAESASRLAEPMVIKSSAAELRKQLRRVCGKNTLGSAYIHQCSVDWLRQAIDDKIAKDQAEEETVIKNEEN